MSAYETLLRLATPRPNGSGACERTARMIADRLQGLGAELHLQRFFLRPYMQPVAGLFFLLAGALCFVLASKRRYWAALAVALVIPAVYVAEFEFNVPIVTWAGGRDGVNVVADFLPAGGPAEKYITFAAHYDSKTDLFDHEQRRPIYSFAPVAMGCLLAASVLGIVSSVRKWGRGAHRICLALGCVGVAGLLMLALAFGGGLFVPLGRQSPGARDDASAVAVLLAVADQIAADPQQLGKTAVRFALFGGEEVNMQGSRHIPGYWPDRAKGLIEAWSSTASSLAARSPSATGRAQALFCLDTQLPNRRYGSTRMPWTLWGLRLQYRPDPYLMTRAACLRPGAGQ